MDFNFELNVLEIVILGYKFNVVSFICIKIARNYKN